MEEATSERQLSALIATMTVTVTVTAIVTVTVTVTYVNDPAVLTHVSSHG